MTCLHLHQDSPCNQVICADNDIFVACVVMVLFIRLSLKFSVLTSATLFLSCLHNNCIEIVCFPHYYTLIKGFKHRQYVVYGTFSTVQGDKATPTKWFEFFQRLIYYIDLNYTHFHQGFCTFWKGFDLLW